MSIEVLGREVQMHYTMGVGGIGIVVGDRTGGGVSVGVGVLPTPGKVGDVVPQEVKGNGFVDFWLDYPDFAAAESFSKMLSGMIKDAKRVAKAAKKRKANGGDND
jgi:hypothetical protein